MKRDFNVYLDDILEAIKNIEEYTKGLTFKGFGEDRKAVDAVIRNFEILGEATKHIPEKIRKKCPKIPWRDMAGMRDRIIHEYFGVNLKVVWKTIKERLPEVRHLIEIVLREIENY